MTHFDNLMKDLDTIQDDTFSIPVLVDGQSGYQGVFDEKSDQFEGVGTMYRTIKFTESFAPSLSMIEKDMTVITLVKDGRTFTVHHYNIVDDELVLELRE